MRKVAAWRMKKSISFILALCMAAGCFAFMPPTGAYASAVGVKNFMERDASGKYWLKLDWSQDTLFSDNVMGARVSWVDENGSTLEPYLAFEDVISETTVGGVTQVNPIKSVLVDIDRFKNGILYQLKIDFFREAGRDSGGAITLNNIIASYTGYSVFLKKIDLQASSIRSDETKEDLNTGEKEAGFKPAIEVVWRMPRVYVYDNNASDDDPFTITPPTALPGDPVGKFMRIYSENGDPGDEGVAAYNAALNAIRRLDGQIDEFNLMLGLQNYFYSTNRAEDCNEIYIKRDFGVTLPAVDSLKAEVKFGSVTFTSQIKKVDPANPEDDRYSIYLLGRRDETLESQFPESDAEWFPATQAELDAVREKYVPREVPEADFKYVLRHNDIYPGSVYNINAVLEYFKNGNEVIETEGFIIIYDRLPVRQTTQLRLIISKISDEFVKASVYRINRGNDYVMGNAYTVTLRSQAQTSLEPIMQVRVSDIADRRETLQAYIRVPNQFNPYFYTAFYVDSNLTPLLQSSAVPYVLTETGSDAPLIPRGVVIEELRYRPETRTTDVTISWDKPDNWESSNLNNLFVEFDLSTSYLTSDNNEPLYDNRYGENVYVGTFKQTYRTVLAVQGTEIRKNVSNDRLFYTIIGAPENLFKVDGANMTSSSYLPIDIYDQDHWGGEREKESVPAGAHEYPNFLLPNTRYFIILRTVNQGDFPTSTVRSNNSLASSFTTYPTNYTPPLPWQFMVTDNSISPKPPAPGVQYAWENSVSLRNSAVSWDYTKLYDPEKDVFYELYISDDPMDASPQLAGITNDISFESWGQANWMENMRLPQAANLEDDLVKGVVVNTASGTHINWGGIIKYGGEPLQPNKMYYFWLRTYIIEKDKLGVDALNGEQKFSVMLSVTTRPYPQDPDDSNLRLIAPVDLAVAKDEDGELMITGESVVLEWSSPDVDVLFELVITTDRDLSKFIDPENGLPFGDPALGIVNTDQLYESFIKEFDNDDGIADRRLILDSRTEGTSLLYDADEGKYRYTIDRWLFPNSLYFASVRAVARGDRGEEFFYILKNTSAYVTVPFTTLLLDAPFDLAAVIDAQLGIEFIDTEPGYTSNDYYVYLRGPNDPDFVRVGGTNATVVRDGEYVYVRLFKLDFNTAYDVRVMRGGRELEVVHTVEGMKTRDSFHAVEVEWIGPATDANDPYLSYQIAILSERELKEFGTDHIVYFELGLSNVVKFDYIKDGRQYGYNISENYRTINNPDIMLYHAVIVSKPVRLRNGAVVVRPLEANMSYHVLVRTVKRRVDGAGGGGGSGSGGSGSGTGGGSGVTVVEMFSKYAGPVTVRTDFLQSAQDDKERQENNERNFWDELAKLEREVFYMVDVGDAADNKYLIKEDKVAGQIRSSYGSSFLLDLSITGRKAPVDTIYIPGGVLDALHDYTKSLTIRVPGAEYVLNRNTIDVRYGDDIEKMRRGAGTDNLFVRLRSRRLEFMQSYAPKGSKGITDVYGFGAAVFASSKSYSDINEIVTSYIYDERTGLARSKLNAIEVNLYGGPDWNEGMSGWYDDEGWEAIAENRFERERKERDDAYIKELVEDIRGQASYKIGDILEARNGYRSIVVSSLTVAEFGSPMGVRLSHDRQAAGKVSPFISYDEKEWFKLAQNIDNQRASVGFQVIAPGLYSAVSANIAVNDMPDRDRGGDDFTDVANKLDLSEVFADIGTSLRPEAPVRGSEAALMYQAALGREPDTFGMGIPRAIEALGLGDVIKPGTQNQNLTRQQAAEILYRMYREYKGLSAGVAGSTKPAAIRDIDLADSKYWMAIQFCAEQGILALSGGKFDPQRLVTRVEFIGGVAKVIEG